MARPKKPASRPVRLSEEAIRLAHIASGYTGEAMVDYVSRIVAEHSQADIERLHPQFVKDRNLSKSKEKKGET